MSPYINFYKSIDVVNFDRILCWPMPQGVDNVSESNQYMNKNSKSYKK